MSENSFDPSNITERRHLKTKERRNPLTDHTNHIDILIKSGGGGGGSQATSPKPLPVAKAGDSPLQSTSENKNITINNGSEIISPVKNQSETPETKNEEKENSPVQPAPEATPTVDCIHEEADEDKFEDAWESKLSLSVLAEDLNKIHLTTPGRLQPQVDNHEFRDVKLLDGSNSLYESFVESEVSFRGIHDSSESAQNTSTRTSSTPVQNRSNVSNNNRALLTPKRDDGSGNISFISENSVSFDDVSKRSNDLTDKSENKLTEKSLHSNQEDSANSSFDTNIEMKVEDGSSLDAIAVSFDDVSKRSSDLTDKAENKLTEKSLHSNQEDSANSSFDTNIEMKVEDGSSLDAIAVSFDDVSKRSSDLTDKSENKLTEKSLHSNQEDSANSSFDKNIEMKVEDGSSLDAIAVSEESSIQDSIEDTNNASFDQNIEIIVKDVNLPEIISVSEESSKIVQEDSIKFLHGAADSANSSQNYIKVEILDQTKNSSENKEKSTTFQMDPALSVESNTSQNNENLQILQVENSIVSSNELSHLTSDASKEEEKAQINRGDLVFLNPLGGKTTNAFEVYEESQIIQVDLSLSSNEVRDPTSNNLQYIEKSQNVKEDQILSSIEVNNLTKNTSQQNEKCQSAEENQMSSGAVHNLTDNTSQENEMSKIGEEDDTPNTSQNIEKFHANSFASSIEVHDLKTNISHDNEKYQFVQIEDSIISSTETGILTVNDTKQAETVTQTSKEDVTLPLNEANSITANTTLPEELQTNEEYSISSSKETSVLIISNTSEKVEEPETNDEGLILSSIGVSDQTTNVRNEDKPQIVQEVSMLCSTNLTSNNSKSNDDLPSNEVDNVEIELKDSLDMVNFTTTEENDQVISDGNSLSINHDKSLPLTSEVDVNEQDMSLDLFDVPFVKQKTNLDLKKSPCSEPDPNMSGNSSAASLAELEEKLRSEFVKTSQKVDRVLNNEDSVNLNQSKILQETIQTLSEASLEHNGSLDTEPKPAALGSEKVYLAIEHETDLGASEIQSSTQLSSAEKYLEVNISSNYTPEPTIQTTQPDIVSPKVEPVVEQVAVDQVSNMEVVLIPECEDVVHPELKSAEDRTETKIVSDTGLQSVEKNNQIDISQPDFNDNSEVKDVESKIMLDIAFNPLEAVKLCVSSHSIQSSVEESAAPIVLSDSLIEKRKLEPERLDSGSNEIIMSATETISVALVTDEPEFPEKDINQGVSTPTSAVLEKSPMEIVESETLCTLEKKPIHSSMADNFSDIEQKLSKPTSIVEIPSPTVFTPVSHNKNGDSLKSEENSIQSIEENKSLSQSVPKPYCAETTLKEDSFNQSFSQPAFESLSEKVEIQHQSNSESSTNDSEKRFSSVFVESFPDLKESYNTSNESRQGQSQAELNPQAEEIIAVPQEILDISKSELLSNFPVQTLESIELELMEVSPVKNIGNHEFSPIKSVTCNNKIQKDSNKNMLKSRKPDKTIDPKTSPKRNLLNDFKASQTKNSPKTENRPFCEFNIPSEEKTDNAPLEFDERLAEEAANVSEHILNLSQEIMDSDSDDNNTTVIVNSQSAKIKKSSTSPVQKVISPVKKLTAGQLRSAPNNFNSIDSLPIESYMQSMRSVVPAHLNQSEAGPITADQLSTQDLEFQDGANLDLDFFNQVGSSKNTNKTSLSLTRDSLYVKFDPIVGALVSKTVGDEFAMPPPPPPEDDINKEEPQVESKQVGQGDAEKTPGRSPALEAVQKLISLTPPSATINSVHQSRPDRASVAGTPTTTGTPKSSPLSQENLQKELKKLEELMKDREASYQTELSKKQTEVEKRESEMETVMLRLAEKEAELKAASEQEYRLKKEVQEKTKAKQQLSLVMEEYEQTISQLVAQKEQEKKGFEVQKDLIMKERDTAMQHLNNMEIAFNDVHQKYERSKTVIEGMKENENELKKSLVEYDEAIKTQNARYEALKNHAIKQLESANTELDQMRRCHKAEIDKLSAMLRKAEVQVKSLEEAMERKLKENQELTAICDELISKVGSSD